MAAGSGYGADGFSLIRAFHEAGVDVRLKPTAVLPPIPMGCAQMLVKSLDIDCDYIIHHVDPDSLGLTEGEKNYTGKKIAWTMWEFTSLGPDLIDTMAEKLDGYDMLLVYDEVSKQALEPHAEKAGVPVRILQGGVWVDDWKGVGANRSWEGTFRFGMLGQLHARKNPFAAIEAWKIFREEFPDVDVEFHFKTNVMGLHPIIEQVYPGIKIFYDVWPESRVKEFYESIHCYVAPSWGEGKNLPALESQISGIPVIYSDFGGHRQWGSSDYGWPVGGELQSHLPEEAPDMLSMRVDTQALAAAMKDAYLNRDKTRQMGATASRVIPPMCDWVGIVKKLLDTI